MFFFLIFSQSTRSKGSCYCQCTGQDLWVRGSVTFVRICTASDLDVILKSGISRNGRHTEKPSFKYQISPLSTLHAYPKCNLIWDFFPETIDAEVFQSVKSVFKITFSFKALAKSFGLAFNLRFVWPPTCVDLHRLALTLVELKFGRK